MGVFADLLGMMISIMTCCEKKNNNTCSGMEKMYMSYNDSGGGCQCGGKACWKKQLKVGKYGQIPINKEKVFQHERGHVDIRNFHLDSSGTFFNSRSFVEGLESMPTS